jgi:hypothetical protein
MRMRHIVTCSLTGCTEFFQINSQKAIFFKTRTKKLLNLKLCFDFLEYFRLKYSSPEEEFSEALS